MKSNARMVSLGLAVLMALAIVPAATAEAGIKTIEIPSAVVEMYEEYGVDESTLRKEYSDLTWAEHVALDVIRDDDEIRPVFNGMIHTALSAELTDEYDGVRMKIAGSWYTNTHPEEDEEE